MKQTRQRQTLIEQLADEDDMFNLMGHQQVDDFLPN
jgi:hypothetical protein